MLSRCFFDFSVGVGAFVTELSQISSFFSTSGRDMRPGLMPTSSEHILPTCNIRSKIRADMINGRVIVLFIIY